MKLFIWNEPYHVPYGASCLYVIANTLEEAKNTAKKALIASYGYADDDGHRIAFAEDHELGEPTRVLDGPYAEVYQWSE